jgi:hypothetical protein
MIMDEIKQGMSVFGDVVEFMRDAQDYTKDSLPSYTKSTNVVSAVYIQDSLADEDIMVPLMDVLNQLYVSWVLAALNLNMYIAGGRRVKDLLRTVSGESMMGFERAVHEAINPQAGLEGAGDPAKDTTAANARLTTSRLIALDLIPRSPGVGEGETVPGNLEVPTKANKLMVYLYVHLLARVMPAEAATGFISLNFKPALWQRIRMLKAGEIKFGKDFLVNMDLMAKHRTALKNDTTGVLFEMLQRQQHNSNKSITSMIMDITTDRNHNCANTILVTDSETFRKACNDAGVNFEDVAQRQKFFSASYTMIVVVVDTMINRVHMYFNGIAAKGEYTFNQISRTAKGQQNVEMTDVMNMLAKGAAPRI